MKIKNILILILISTTQNLFSQNKIDSVAMLLKMNYIINYPKVEFEEYDTKAKKHTGFINIESLIDNQITYLLSPDYKVKYKLDTIYSDYFKEYYLLNFKDFGSVFEYIPNGSTTVISTFDKNSPDDFLVAVSKNGDLKKTKFISGNIYLSNLGFLNNAFSNDNNLTQEIFKLRMTNFGYNYSILKKIEKKLDYEIYEIRYEYYDLSNRIESKLKVYFDLNTLSIIKYENAE